MSKFIELPSGHILNTEDIIFVSGIKHSKTDDIYEIGWEFNVVWANRISETLKYDGYDICDADREALKDELFNTLTHEMIYE